MELYNLLDAKFMVESLCKYLENCETDWNVYYTVQGFMITIKTSATYNNYLLIHYRNQFY